MTVAVVGSVNMDVVARVPRIPGPGETLLATGVSRGGGGKGANQAVAAARAGGAPSVFVGAVGADADGDALRAALAADGIDISGLVTASAPTGVALISVSDDGENAIVVVAGANATVDRLADDQRALVAAADVVLAQLEIPVAGVLAAAAARADHAPFVLNAAPSGALAERGAGARLLAEVDVLVVNEHELRDILSGAGDDTEHELDAAVDDPASPAWSPAIPGKWVSGIASSRPAASSVGISGSSRHVAPSTPTTALSQHPASSSVATTSTPKLYPSLNPPLTQRSSALQALFDTPKQAGSTAPVGIVGRKNESPSVRDMVRSFEEEGVLGRGYSKEGLKRAESRGL